jgi:CheY-like chemotaxis protein
LVADDNANIQKMVMLAFQERGIDVTSVGNGEAAVRRLPDLNPDLVLADVFMPVRNGYEVCEFVKKDARFAHIPVILLVGAFDPLDEKEARRVGADGVLKKPFVPPDPLIAMVMSALEKNPKLAAEVAKSKKAASEPVSAAPFEAPSIPEARPIPEFPEPNPDEEDAIYGFGNSARSLDDANLPEGSKEPKALDAESVEDAVASETAHKIWRRTAMDFEIPVAEASRPALSADEHLDSAMFPSERDVPPRHVRMRDVESDDDAIVEAKASPSFETPAMAVVPPVVEAPSPSRDAFEVAKLPVLAVLSTEPLRSEPPVQTPVQSATPKADAEALPVEPKPALHWMDMMAPLPSAPPSSDWMSALRASAVSESRPLFPVAPPVEASVSAPATATPVDSSATLHDSHSEPAAESDASAVESTHETGSDATVSESQRTPSVEGHSEFQPPTEPPFFADDLVAAEAPGFDHNLMVAAPDPPVPANLKDPDLDGPVAVHVRPEPLLVNDDPGVSTDYNSHPEETAPMHSLDYPMAPGSVRNDSESGTNVEEPPVTSESVLEEASAHSESFAPMTEPEREQPGAPLASAEPNPVGWTERTPTVPPPNREALADIPFLTPPAAFQSQAAEGSVDSATVDAVVRKVLERLESQIHGILSQGALKPLVENLLEDELAKKEK